MKENRMKDALESIARRAVSEDINLMPSIAAQLERKSMLQTVRAKPTLAVLIVLLTLILLSGVAYAVGRVTGYIPGIGLVDQSIPLRVLAEPVSVTREGITLTVEQVVVSTDKTVLVYRVEGIPPEAYVSDGQEEGNPGYSSSSSASLEGTPEVSHSTFENFAQCVSDDRLLLPDGSVVLATGGEGSSWASGYKRRFDYAAIPPDVTEAKLSVSCIDGTALGRLPEDWDVSLHFVPAPSDMTVFPVVDIEPSTANQSQSAITVEEVIETNAGYILVGKFRLIEYPSNIVPNGIENHWVEITDADGRAVESFPANGMQFENELNGEISWAYEVKGKQHAFPLTITFETVPAYILDETTEFEFDTGKNPQVGQTWTLEPDIQLAGYDIHKISITRTSNGYEFNFKVDPDLELFTPEIKGVLTSRGGGGNDGFGRGEIYFHLEYRGEPPSGKLTVKLGDVRAAIHGPWQMQWSPEPLPASLYGISLYVDQFISLDDGYYLIGHTEWTDDRVTSVSPSGWALKAYDATGREVPIEPAIFGNDQVGQSLQPDQWAYRLYGKNFHGPLTLRVPQMSVEFKQPVRFRLDLSSHEFGFSDQYLGTTWNLDSLPLDVPGILASVSSATYVKQGDLRGFEFAIQADTTLEGLGFTFESGLMTEGMSTVAGGGGSNRDESTGMILSTVLTNAPMQFPLVFSAAGGAIRGTWETKWIPPVATMESTPVLIEQGCLDLYRWKEALAIASSISVPPELNGKLLTQRGALAPEPSLFLSKVDGSEERGLVFGHGTISPDGTKLAFSDEYGVLKIMDLSTRVITTVNAPPGSQLYVFWSPNGNKIAFNVFTDTYHVYIAEADGNILREIPLGNEMTLVRGWSGDGKEILVSTGQDLERQTLRLINIENGTTRDLFTMHGDQVSISPDGKWIAYVAKVVGRMGNGIYISRLDGSEKRLLVQLDHWIVTRPVWSPDSAWLGFSILNVDQSNGEMSVAVINKNICQFAPLGIRGEITTWISP